MIKAPNRQIEIDTAVTGQDEISKQEADRAWVEELRGDCGDEAQLLAFEDLANYLFRVAWNYLKRRQGDLDILGTFTADELSFMAEDFAQETLEKFVRDDFKILQQYRGEARFLSWAARIVTNRASEDLRKVEWKRRNAMPEAPSIDDRAETDPELTAVCSSVAEIISSCLDHLPEHYRRAFLGRVLEGENSKSIGQELNLTANAVDLLVFRARPKLRRCLELSGIDVDILEIFGDSDSNGNSMQILA